MAMHRDILETVGDTPTIRLNRMAPEGVELFVKVEAANPMGSVKDRLALGIIEAAEKSGELKPGQTVVEATSGNTGIGLAMVCAAKGYPLVVVMAENFSLERRKLLRFLGARIVLTPPWAKGTGMLAVARRLADDNGWFLCRQFENEAGPEFHSRTTAREILHDFGENGLTAWVSGFGTGGTLKGVARVLRERSPHTRIIVAEPDNAALVASGIPQMMDSHGEPTASHPAFHPHPMQGWSPDFISKLTGDAVAGRLIDGTVGVAGEEAMDCAKRLARTEGIFCGITGGATLAAAIRVAETCKPGSRILAMLPDTGERYLSTPLFDGIGVEMDDEEARLLETAMPAIAVQPPAAPADQQPEPVNASAKTFVTEAIASNPKAVVMFGLSWCEFCWSIRRLLTRLEIPFVTVELDNPDFRTRHDVPAIRAALRGITGAATIPQLFLGGEAIGGCSEIMDLAQSGELQRRLADKGIACALEVEIEPSDFLPNWVSRPREKAA